MPVLNDRGLWTLINGKSHGFFMPRKIWKVYNVCNKLKKHLGNIWKSGVSREVFVGIWKVETRKHISTHDHLSGEMVSIRAAKHQRHVAQHYSYCLVLHFLCQCWDVVYGYGGMLQATNWGGYPPKKNMWQAFGSILQWPSRLRMRCWILRKPP